jgi:hypothetical protein
MTISPIQNGLLCQTISVVNRDVPSGLAHRECKQGCHGWWFEDKLANQADDYEPDHMECDRAYCFLSPDFRHHSTSSSLISPVDPRNGSVSSSLPMKVFFTWSLV